MAQHKGNIKDDISIITMLFTQIYNEYKDKILDKVFNKIIIKPWMKYREIEIIKEILRHLQPQKCLEWGAGYSTIYFPIFLIGNSKWISIEHEKNWARKIKNINQNSNIEIFHIRPNCFPWTDEYGDGAYSDLTDYITFPSRFGKFDFILVDGRARKDSLIKAYELVKNEGVVVLHDANRKYYHEPFRLYKYHALFKDYRKDAGGLWVGTKGMNIKKVLNVDKHRKLWQIYNKIGKVVKV